MADFQAALEGYQAEDITVIAGSVDPVDKTKALADELGLSYPIAYGLDAETVSRLTGGFYEPEKKFLHPTGIVVRPNKTVEIAVYSTGAVGRFVAQDALNVVKYYKSQMK